MTKPPEILEAVKKYLPNQEELQTYREEEIQREEEIKRRRNNKI